MNPSVRPPRPRPVARLAALAGVVAIAAIAPAAWAATARFEDVPAGHWAAGAVDYVAVRQPMMAGVAAERFGGGVQMTRGMFALTLDRVLPDLEKRSKGSWGTTQASSYDFQDVPDGPQRDAVNRVAGWYRVFDGMPGVSASRLRAEEPLTREQMAQALAVLLRRAEARGMMARDRRQPPKGFKDVPGARAGAEAIDVLTNDFQVVDGYPDGTFRPDEPLTRYQFAAAAAKIFPHVQALIARSAPSKAPAATPRPRLSPLPAEPPRRYLEDVPVNLLVDLGAGGLLGGSGRLVVYNGILYSQLDFRPSLAAANLHEFGLRLGAGVPLWRAASAQPYVAGRFYGNGFTNALMTGGGLLMHLRPSQRYGLSLGAETGFPIAASDTVPPGTMYAELLGGGQLYLADHLALTGEVAWAAAPTGLTPAGAGLGTGLRGSLGLAFGY